MNTQKITLATLPQATEQAVFDQVAVHMLTQGRRSLSYDGSCAYRGANGLQCAAGCLIGDDEAHENLERHTWHELVADGLVPHAHAYLIRRLQVIHDTYGARYWRDMLIDLSETTGLSCSAIDAVTA